MADVLSYLQDVYEYIIIDCGLKHELRCYAPCHCGHDQITERNGAGRPG